MKTKRNHVYNLETDCWYAEDSADLAENDQLYFVERIGDIEIWCEKGA